MDDPLSKTVEVVCKEAEGMGIQVFCGYLAETNGVPSVRWNREHGGGWRKFLACAKAFNASIFYIDWSPFEQSDIDDPISRLELTITEDDQKDTEEETRELMGQLRAFQSKVGVTCVIDLAFIANGVIHIYQETADWFDEFGDLAPDDESIVGDEESPKSISKSDLRRWATALASNPKYSTSTRHESLLEEIAGEEFPELPTYEIMRLAETIYLAEYKEAADEKLANEIHDLRNQGLNMKAIAIKLGISQGRVSGLASLITQKKKGPA